MTNHLDSVVDGAVIVRGLGSGFAQDVQVRSHLLRRRWYPTSVGGTKYRPHPI